MARNKKEYLYDLPIQQNPNFKQFRNTNIYLSKMGDVVRINRYGKEEKAIIHTYKGESHFYCDDEGNKRKRYVARSVYETFKGAVPDDCKVVHVDLIKSNNNIDNLKLVTRSEASTFINKNKPKKMVHDLNTNKIYRSRKECAEALGYCESVISKVIRGKYSANTNLKLQYITEDEVLKMDNGNKKNYSIYKDGEFLTTGTKEECSKFMGWTDNTLWVYMCKSYKGLYKKKRIEVFEV